VFFDIVERDDLKRYGKSELELPLPPQKENHLEEAHTIILAGLGNSRRFRYSGRSTGGAPSPGRCSVPDLSAALSSCRQRQVIE
jgi:hypothetical protein